MTLILRLFIICPPSEIRADPLKLSIDYTQNHMKRLKGMTFILYSTWDKPSIFWHFFCILLVLCIWRPKICFIKYHTVHIVLHKCNNMPVLELRVISILSCASVILQSIRKNKNETELRTQIVCLILSYFVISIHVHNRSVPFCLISVGF